ncbi:MAG: tRNA (adenosine(37)-N6)-threonylcarbamoyltransferase complex ATPase subunit type 1 TsaE [Pseudodesulfovibrio sp.]|nr:tRNA (adenosine(37)-N6)-threonylcarbamoyltransferase complex ATPase subunit type 1 TsaE [Pseudodesulfovibrio sp.]
MPIHIRLKDTDETIELGHILAKAMAETLNPPALLLQGALGSGKTTLVRGLVESLPGSDMAEVSSPSFNIFNLYPTVPPVAHFDLYRLEGMPPDDALFEYLDDSNTLIIVEWIQFLDREMWPDNAFFLEWTPSEAGRSLTLHAMGKTAQKIVDILIKQLKNFM